MTANDNEIVVYQPDETVRLDVRLDGDTVWLTQNQMTNLFQRDRTVITRHINNVFSEGELDEKSNVHFLHIPFSDKPVKAYSLNVIISVGYRVKSIRGTQFRIWATNVLREYLLRGYVVNTRLAQLEDKVDRRLAKTEADVAELKGNVDFFVICHDRFIIVDQKEIYWTGASLKDAGRLTFAARMLAHPSGSAFAESSLRNASHFFGAFRRWGRRSFLVFLILSVKRRQNGEITAQAKRPQGRRKGNATDGRAHVRWI
jgi:hypothetical protein